MPPKKNSTQVKNVNGRQDVLSKKDNSSWWEVEKSFQEHLAKEYGAPVQYETPTRHRGIPSEFSGGLPTMEISKYNKGVSALALDNPFESYQDIKAKNQSAWDKWGNAGVKAAGIAGFTLLDGTVGLINGLFQSVSNAITGDAPWYEGLWNNATTNFSAGGQNALEEWFPNLYTEEEMNRAWYDPRHLVSANFWADKMMKNIVGYSAPMILLGGSAGRLAFRGLGGASAKKSFIRNLRAVAKEQGDDVAEGLLKGNVGKVFKNPALEETAGRLMQGINEGKIGLEGIKAGLRADASTIKRATAWSEGIGSLYSASAEAVGEAKMNQLDVIEQGMETLNQQLLAGQITQDEYTEAKVNLEKVAAASSNSLYLYNLALLTLTELGAWRQVISRGYKVNKNTLNSITRKGDKFVAKPTSKIAKVGRLAKSNLIEGEQERFQTAGQNTFNSYNEAKWNPLAEQQINSFTDFMGELVTQAFGTNEGWESWVIGSLSKALGTPSIRSQSDFKMLGFIPTAGSVMGEIRSIGRQDAATSKHADMMNAAWKVYQDINPIFRAVTADNTYQTLKEEALFNNDEKAYKDAENRAFTNLVGLFHDSGKIDELYNKLEAMNQMEPDSFREFVKSEDGSSPFDNWSDQQINDYKREIYEKNKFLIDNIVDIKQSVETKWGNNVSKEVKDELFMSLSDLSNSTTRINGLENRLKTILGNSNIIREDVISHIDNAKLFDLKENQHKIEEEQNILEKEKQSVKEELESFTKDWEDFQGEQERLIDEQNKKIKKLNSHINRKGKRKSSEPIEFQQKLESEIAQHKKDIEDINSIINDISNKGLQRRDEYSKKIAEIQSRLDKNETDRKDLNNRYDNLKRQLENILTQDSNFTLSKGDNSELLNSFMDDLSTLERILGNVQRTNPFNADEILNGINDLSQLYKDRNRLTNSLAKWYASVQTEGFNNSLQKELDKLNEELSKKVNNERIKRYKDYSVVVGEDLNGEKTDPQSYQVRVINDQHYLEDKEGNLHSITKEDLLNKYVLLREYAAEPQKPKEQEVKVEDKPVQPGVEPIKEENGYRPSQEKGKKPIPVTSEYVEDDPVSAPEEALHSTTGSEGSAIGIDTPFGKVYSNIIPNEREPYQYATKQYISKTLITGNSHKGELFTLKQLKELIPDTEILRQIELGSLTSDKPMYLVLSDENGIILLDNNGNKSGNIKTISEVGEAIPAILPIPEGYFYRTEEQLLEENQPVKGTRLRATVSDKKALEIATTFRQKRDQIYEQLNEDNNKKGYTVQIKGKTTGLTRVDNLQVTNDKGNPPTRTLTIEDKERYEVNVASEKSVVYGMKVQPGDIYIRDKKTGNVFKGLPTTLTDSEVNTIEQLIRRYIENLASKVENPEKSGSINIFEAINNLVFFTGFNNTSSTGNELAKSVWNSIFEAKKKLRDYKFSHGISEKHNFTKEIDATSKEINELYKQLEDINADYAIAKNPKNIFNLTRNGTVEYGNWRYNGQENEEPVITLSLLNEDGSINEDNLNTFMEDFIRGTSEANRKYRQIDFNPRKTKIFYSWNGENFDKTSINPDNYFYSNGIEIINNENNQKFQQSVIFDFNEETQKPLKIDKKLNVAKKLKAAKKLIGDKIDGKNPEEGGKITLKENINPSALLEKAKKKLSTTKEEKITSDETKEEVIVDTEQDATDIIARFLKKSDITQVDEQAGGVIEETIPLSEIPKDEEWLRLSSLSPKEYTKEDINFIKSELSRIFGKSFIDNNFILIANLIKNKAFGSTKNGIMTLSTLAEEGTGYHEAMHIVMDNILTKEESERVLREAIQDPLIRSKMEELKSHYSNLSETNLIHEALAESFREYMLNKGVESKWDKIKRKVREFFEKIARIVGFMNKVDSLSISEKTFITDFFSKIDRGHYLGKVVARNTIERLSKKINADSKFDSVNKQRLINQINQSITAYFSQIVLRDKEVLYNLLGGEVKINESEIYDTIKQRLHDGYARNSIKLLKDLANSSTGIQQERYNALQQYISLNSPFNEELADTLSKSTGSYSMLANEFMFTYWDKIVQQHKEYLQQEYGINFREDGRRNIDDILDEVSEDERTKDTVGSSTESSIFLSNRNSASRIVKLLVGTISMQNEQDGKLIINELGYPYSESFSKNFSLLTNYLAGSTTLQEMINRLFELDSTMPELRHIVSKIISRFGFDKNFESLDVREGLLQIQFFQAFSNYKYNYFGIEHDKNTSDLYNLSDFGSKSLVTNQWSKNSSDSPFLIKRDDGIFYVSNVNEKIIKEIKKQNPEIDNFPTNFITAEPLAAILYLEKLGITFSEITLEAIGELYNNNKTLYKKTFGHKVNQIYNSLKKSNVPWMLDTKSDNSGDIDFFSKLEIKYNPNFFENSHLNLEGKRVYDCTLNSSMTFFISTINRVNSIEELREIAQWTNSPYLNNSELLKPGGKIFNENGTKKDVTLKLNILSFAKEGQYNRGKEIGVLKFSEKLRVDLEMSGRGNYSLLRPADNSLDRYISIERNWGTDNKASSDESSMYVSFYDENYVDAFMGYLQDEINQANSLRNTKYRNYNEKEQVKGALIDLFSAASGREWGFRDKEASDVDIAIEEVKKWKKSLYSDTVYQPNWEAMRNGFELVINSWINSSSEQIFTDLVDSKLLYTSEQGNFYVNFDLINPDGTTISKDKPESEINIKTALFNLEVANIIAKIEQTKLFSGNPAFVKSTNDGVKRFNMVVSTKNISEASPHINSLISSKLKRFDKIKTNGFETLVVANDQELYSSVYNGKKLTETDGQSLVSLDAARELMYRSAIWGFGIASLEDLYKYQIQNEVYWRIKNNEVESKEDLVNHFNDIFNTDYTVKNFPKLKLNKNSAVLNILKPQGFGFLGDTNNQIPIGIKTSFDIIAPSKFRNFETGEIVAPLMQQLYNTMTENGVGILSFQSSVKGYTNEVNENGVNPSIFEDVDGTRNVKDFSSENFVHHPINYQTLGIQVITGDTSHNSSTRGTQAEKMILSNLYDNGKIRNEFEDIISDIEMLPKLNAQRLNLSLQILKDKLKLSEKNGLWSYDKRAYKDGSEFIRALQDECNRRNVPYNIPLEIEMMLVRKNDNETEQEYEDRMRNTPGIDILINGDRIQPILMAIAESNVIKRKVYGKPSIQASQTFYNQTIKVRNENGGFTTINPEVKEVEVNGKKQLVSNNLKFYTNENGKITKMQVLIPNPFENIKDVDDSNLDPRLLDIIGFRIPTQDLSSMESIEIVGFLPKEFGDMIVVPTDIVEKAGSDFDVDKLNIYISNSYRIKDKLIKITPDITYEKYLEQNIFSLTDKGNILSEEEFEIQKLENQTYDIWNKIMLHPANWENLTSPITSGDLAKHANEIAELYGESENGTLFDYFTTSWQLRKFKANMDGRSTIGIAVNFGTFHKIAQTIDISLLSKSRNVRGRSYNTKINLKHNGDSNEIKLGSYLSQDGQMISQMLQKLSSATVDNAKETTLGKLNFGPQVFSTACFLALIGVSQRDIEYFLNQPIIRDYVKLQEVNESITAEEYYAERFDKSSNDKRFNKLNKEGIVYELLRQYGVEGVTKQQAMRMFYEKFKTTNSLHSTTDLLNNIKNRNSKNFNRIKQVDILAEFLRYQEMAKLVGDFQQAIKYDTNAYGSNIHELEIMIKRSEKIINSGDFKNADILFKDGFISPYYNSAKNVNQMFRQAFFTSFNNTAISNGYDYLVNAIINNMNLSTSDAARVLDKYIKTSISMEMLNLPLRTNVNDNITTVGLLGKLAMYGTFSGKLKDTFSKEQYLNNPFARDLHIFDRRNLSLLSNMSLKSDQRDKNITDEYIEGLEEIMDNNPQLGLYLFSFLMKQNGYQNSPLDFRRVFPTYRLHSETYSDPTTNWILPDLITQIFSNINNDANNILNNFFINNIEDNNIIPQVRNRVSKFIGNVTLSRYLDDSGNPIVPFYKKFNKKTKSWDVYETLTDRKVTEIPTREIRNNMQELVNYTEFSTTIPIDNITTLTVESIERMLKLNGKISDSQGNMITLEEFNSLTKEEQENLIKCFN